MILVLGSTGFLGRRVCRYLDKTGIEYISTPSSKELDFRDKNLAVDFFLKSSPTHVINCAAFVGGIQFGYKYPAEIFHNNLMISLNVLEASRISGVKKIINPISNCAYPADLDLLSESDFWNGQLHESVLAYGFVRKASWVGGFAYFNQYGLDTLNLIFPNMYGPGDHFDEERSHALGALIMKIVKAKENKLDKVVVWGSGTPMREWLHVDDAAEILVKSMKADSYLYPINIGVGKVISIFELAKLIKSLVGYEGELVLDNSKPDGAPYKKMNGDLGKSFFMWSPTRKLREGLIETIQWYNENRNVNGL